MIKSKSGFTIVELLIVIVIIAILAAITIVAYNGIQKSAQNSARLSDVNAIMKALELYRAKNGNYPPSSMTYAAACTTHNNGYSFSDATDGTWLKPLITDGIIAKTPTPFPNDCNSYYSYLNPGASAYGCNARTREYYIITVVGVDASQPLPAGATSSATWTPCSGATAGWASAGSTWNFIKEA